VIRLDASTPPMSGFALVRFEVVGGNRQALTQQLGGAVINRHPRGADASQVAFTATQIAPGVFEVTPDGDLPPGEYAFAVTPVTDGDDAADTRFFDFSTERGGE
jgi:hypothetical protein